MKRLLIIAAAMFLAACSSSVSIVGTQQPILNIDAALAPAIQVSTAETQARIENKTNQPINLVYHLYWYDAQGVTQVWHGQEDSLRGNLLLPAKQQEILQLTKPTPESRNYRLYLQ